MSVASVGHLNACAHPGCLCQVQPGERYCSEYCRRVIEADPTKPGDPPRYSGSGCGCGHAACEGGTR